MPSGEIILSLKGEITAYYRYETDAAKNKTINKWKKTYGPMFIKCTIQDKPDPIIQLKIVDEGKPVVKQKSPWNNTRNLNIQSIRKNPVRWTGKQTF